MLCHKIALAEEVVLLEGDRPEVDVDHAQDRPETLTTLRTGGGVHHVDRLALCSLMPT
jgi:hypothetical protein